MSNQYEVLGKAPGAEDLKKLSPDNIQLGLLPVILLFVFGGIVLFKVKHETV